MNRGRSWGGLGLAVIVSCLHALPAHAVWTPIEAPPASAPAVQAPDEVAAPDSATFQDDAAKMLERQDGESSSVETVLDEPPAPEVLAAPGRTCCFYKSGFFPDPVTCRERTCVPTGAPCPLELHGCPLWTSFTVNSCGACR